MKSLKKTMMGVGVATLILSACAGNQQAAQLTASGLNPAKFDTTIQSKPVKLYTLKNANGMEVCITNYGGRIVSLCVPDKDGNLTDVVLVPTRWRHRSQARRGTRRPPRAGPASSCTR